MRQLDSSRGEIKIHEILDMNGLDYCMEFMFSDLVTSNGTPLRFDFAVFDDDGNIAFLIEYQGKQHYEAVSRFGGSKALKKQQYNDERKRQYCAKHGYRLIEFSYKEENLITYDYIMARAGYF